MEDVTPEVDEVVNTDIQFPSCDGRLKTFNSIQTVQRRESTMCFGPSLLHPLQLS